MTSDFDVCIVGAGLIGLATARAIGQRHPGWSMLILDKADSVAAHQSSHNSGVVHSGLYYKPGSMKARLCVEGRELMYELCKDAGIAHRRTGKLVIASDASEVPALDELERRGVANGLDGMERIGARGIADHEPEAVGVDALFVPEAGIVDYAAVAGYLAEKLTAEGASICTDAEVTSLEHTTGGMTAVFGDRSATARVLVNCAGLQSDRVAMMAGVDPSVRIVPFRGEYYRLSDEANPLVRALIYPVPDPRFPFLGVHFTRRIDGSVEVGPNAILALGREQYRGAPIDWRDVRESVAFRGLQRLALKHWRSGLGELVSSRSRRMYARLARSLVPATRTEDLLEGGSGVRAQAVTRNGDLVDDFVIEKTTSSVHVLNAPSPGATASLAIGRHIAAEVESTFRR